MDTVAGAQGRVAIAVYNAFGAHVVSGELKAVESVLAAAPARLPSPPFSTRWRPPNRRRIHPDLLSISRCATSPTSIASKAVVFCPGPVLRWSTSSRALPALSPSKISSSTRPWYWKRWRRRHALNSTSRVRSTDLYKLVQKDGADTPIGSGTISDKPGSSLRRKVAHEPDAAPLQMPKTASGPITPMPPSA